MKTLKLFITIIVIMLPCIPVSGQTENDLFEGWYVADFTGMYNGHKIYDVFYSEKDFYAEDGLAYLKTIILYTEYAKDHYYSTGISSTDVMACFDILVDMQKDQYCFLKIVIIKIDGTTTEASYDIDEVKWNYPKSGTVGDYYIKLARQLAYN